MMPKAIIVSDYFDLLHKWYLKLFEKVKASGDHLWTIVNYELHTGLKGSKEFMEKNERLINVSAIKYVDKVLISIDKDKTQRASLAYLADNFSVIFEMYFATVGEQNNESILEVPVCREKRIGLLEGLGDKIPVLFLAIEKIIWR